MLYYERKFKKLGFDTIIGVDEAGRGPLAGPVVAAAVLLKKARFINRIDDSKKLTALAREHAFQEISKNSLFGIGIIDEKIIDRVNILQATVMAMEEAINSLIRRISSARCRRAYVIVDGNLKLNIAFPYRSIIGGDGKSKSIAAASILAKVTRDRIMEAYHKLYPQYGFAKHKGYPTSEHRALLRRLGPSEIHRKSFSYA
ncbi:MAG: ribonuclease HII [Candidatus Omnitrophota bacterium]|nr:ribonuclease HII [Candidatus Omnitrophota bacterium]